MRIISKALVIASIVFLTRLFFSCCNCEYQSAEFQYNSIAISNLDHTGWNANIVDHNRMDAAALAFRVDLTDTAFRPPLDMAQINLGFSSAIAMQPCECPFEMFLRSKFSGFSIITLRDFSPDKDAGSDITESFVYQSGWEHMYLPIDTLVNDLNTPFYQHYYELQKSLDFYCKDTVFNDSLQMVFQFHYENGEILADTTEVISIQLSGEEMAL